MNCEGSNESKYIMKYFDGELSEAEEEQFRQHLQNCSKCKEEFSCMETILTALGENSEIEPPANFEAAVMDKVTAFEEKRREKRSKLIVLLYNGTTLLSIILLLIFVADLKQVNVLSAFEQIGKYFNSFSSATTAVLGVVRDLFRLIGDVILVVINVAFSVIRSYYYVFLALIVILFVIQRLLQYVGMNVRREAE
jgi:anti-sigma factor RsiW